METSRRVAWSFVVLMMLSSLGHLGWSESQPSLPAPAQSVGTATQQAFTDGSTEVTGLVGSAISPTIPVNYGHNMTDGSVSLHLEGSKVTRTTTFSVGAGSLNGTLNDTINDGTTIQLTSSAAGPSQAGTNSSTVLSTTNLAGTHAYDTLELLCGIASCGRLVATGDLTLYVNTLRIEQGASIVANDMTTGGSGAGGSTTAATNGRSDGGGGAGHGGTGGAGGGSSGGTGGATYGNGSERGSQGGSVTSSYHSTANGGSGGGYIQIFADQVIVNGSIQAHGGDGDAGSQASSGTGAGGSGGGGGSGGSISIRANSVSVGNGGQIKADGGDGGDGANGAQNGPGFGMYDGGDGGGGGGGGRIVIQTQTNGYANSGTVSALGGSGGTKGMKYGTGVDGVDGSAGSNGVVSTSTWTGYVATSNVTANNGSFTTQPLQSQANNPSPAFITHNAAVPADASLTVLYRTTLNGSGSSWDEWTAWLPLSLSGEAVERHRWIQLSYVFSRTGSASPTLTSLTVEHSSWTTLTSSEFRYDGQRIGPDLSSMSLGLTETVTATGTATQPQFSFDLPSGSTLTDELRVWMQWPVGTNGSTPSFVGATMNGATVSTAAANHSEAGIDFVLPASLVNAQSSAASWTDTNGLLWETYAVDLEMSAPTEMWFGHFTAPWSLEITTDVTQAMNNVILAECGSFYAFTDPTCFGAATAHKFSLSGSTLPAGSTGFMFTIANPSFEWQDAFAPEVVEIQHRRGIETFPNLRVNESFSMILFDGAGEDDLVVEYLGLDWEPSLGFDMAQTLAYHNALKGYYVYLNTDGLEVDASHDLFMTFRVTDANGNELLPRPTYNMTVYPVAPEVGTFTLEGSPSVGMDGERSLWSIDDANFTLKVTDVHQRQTLSVTAELSQGEVAQPMLLPLLWNPDELAYTNIWLPQRTDIGDWNIEISMAELSGLFEADENGLKDGDDLMLRFVDQTGPQLLALNHSGSIEQGDPFSVTVAWSGEADETYEGSVAVAFDGAEVMNKSILSTPAKEATTLFNTSTWNPGQYSVSVHLTDDAGNVLEAEGSATSEFEVLKPWLVHDANIRLEGKNTLMVSGDVDTRSGFYTLTMTQANSTWSFSETQADGPLNLSVEVTDLVSVKSIFNVLLCDATDTDNCQSLEMVLDFTEAYELDVRTTCTLVLVNQTSFEDQTLVRCTLNNNGLVEANARMVIEAFANLSTTSATLVPNGSGEVTVTLLAGEGALNESLTWTLLVENAGGNQRVLEMGEVDLVRTPAQSIGTSDEEDIASESSGILLPAVVGILAVGLLIISLFFYRKGNGVEEKRFSDDGTFATPLTEDQDFPAGVEHGFWGADETVASPLAHENIEPLSEPETVPGPSPETPATSVDEHGYEWYTNDGEHWYRTAGSAEAWTPYQA